MSRPPALGRWIVRRLLPPGLAEALEGDLHEGFRRRAASGGRTARLRAIVWFWWQVATVPWWSLGRRERRMGRPGRAGRAGRTGPREVGMGRARRWGNGGMGDLAADVRVAVRTLLRRPAFAVASILTLCLSIGAATLLFSVTEGVLLRPLPYRDPDRIVTIYLLNEEWRDSGNELLRESWDQYHPSRRHIEAFRESPGPLAEVGSWIRTLRTLSRGEVEEEVWGIRVDRGFFPTLEVEPAMGRLPTASEYAEGAPVAVLRDGLWRERFGADPDVLGSTFLFGDRLHTVIGVMPPGFYFPSESGGDFWTPIPSEETNWVGSGMGRLAPRATPAEASRVLDRIARRLGEEDPALARLGARAVPALDDLVADVRSGVLLLFGTALVVLLVACVNLANLVLVRVGRRRGELAVRAALGAPGLSLARAVFVEVWLVCLVGGGLGLGLAALVVRPFAGALAVSVGSLPRSAGIGLNGTVLAFAVAATVATMLVAGLPGVLGALGRAPAEALAEATGRGGARTRGRSRRALLAVQVGLAALLLAGAGLLVRSAVRANTLDPGFDPDGLAWLSLDPGQDEDDDTGAARITLLDALRTELGRLPDVEAVGFASRPPIQGGLVLVPVRAASAPEDEFRQVAFTRVEPGYLGMLGLPVLRGRVPRRPASPGGPAPVVVSEGLSRVLAPTGTALGMRLLLKAGDELRELEVTAVAADSRQFLLREPVDQLYLIDPAVGSLSFYALLRTSEDARGLPSRARAVLAGSFPNLTVEDQGTTRADVAHAVRHLNLRAELVGALAALAALLAVVGIAGIAAHFLGAQRREIAIRIALGAEPSREVRRVVWHAWAPAATGLLLGLGAALGLAHLVAGLLFGTSARDPLTYLVVAAFLAGVSALAAWVPGRRTAAVDPARALDAG